MGIYQTVITSTLDMLSIVGSYRRPSTALALRSDMTVSLSQRAGHYDIINVFQTLGNLNVLFDYFIEYTYKLMSRQLLNK